MSSHLGTMNIICNICKAQRFMNETHEICCGNGKWFTVINQPPPQVLLSLLTASDHDSIHFQKNIRFYNMAFQMTSFGAAKKEYRPTFRIQGQPYHRIGSLLPEQINTDNQGSSASYLQIFFISQLEQQTERRQSIFGNILKENILQILQNMYQSENNLIQSFQSAKDFLKNDGDLRPDIDNYDIHIYGDREHAPVKDHPGRYHLPTTSEVAVILHGNEDGATYRDIIIRARGDGSLTRINEFNKYYDALQYPIAYPRGEQSYSIDIPLPSGGQKRKYLSPREYYTSQLMVRHGVFNIFHHCRDLLQQLLVDWFSKIESNRLSYITHNQKTVRGSRKKDILTAKANNTSISDIGQKIYLPPSHTGGPRYMQEKADDAITYVQHYGKPDLFITFTCNPEWNEIKDNLKYDHDDNTLRTKRFRRRDTNIISSHSLDNEPSINNANNIKWSHRHDIVARVFNAKMEKMMHLLIHEKLYGPVLAHMYTIEWQKRGLPHAHILLWLQNKVSNSNVDDIIRAEIPDPQKDKKLYDIITKHMIHGPCGQYNRNCPCMKDNTCTKKFPKSFCKTTLYGDEHDVTYRRRSVEDGGFAYQIKNKQYIITNQWVVPYSPILCLLFNAHINVEICNSVKSIKYLCKYINKGTDQIIFSLNEQDKNNEVKRYQIGRYINANEAAWRIFGFKIHSHFPAVIKLQIHLEDEQYITFKDDDDIDNLMESKNSQLMKYFEICKIDSFAKTLLYQEIPYYYTWNTKMKSWKRRLQGKRCLELEELFGPKIFRYHTLSRITFINPKQDTYHLRLLLQHVKGPTSFQDLLIVDDIFCSTYKEACLKRGLLHDDTTWDLTLHEAAAYKSPKYLRDLFVLLLIECQLSNPLHLWNKYKFFMSEDFRTNHPPSKPSTSSIVIQELYDQQYNQLIYNMVLLNLNETIMTLSLTETVASFNLPVPSNIEDINYILLKELSYHEESKRYYEDHIHSLTAEQRMVYDAIIERIMNNTPQH